MKFALKLELRRPAFNLNIDLHSEGTRFGLFGASGAGKSTLIRVIAGLERPEGVIQIDDETWLDSKAGTFLSPDARKVGWVPQQCALLPHLNVKGNLALGVLYEPDRLAEVTTVLGIASLLQRKPNQLSGGEQKRVAIGRALLSRPGLLLLDEPMAGLDWPLRAELFTYLLRVQNQFGVPAIFVSHDPSDIGVFCETVWMMEAGRIAHIGSPEQIFLRPESASQALRAGVENIWRGRIHKSSEGEPEVRIGTQLICTDTAGIQPGESVVVVLPAGEVTLSRALPTETSARNVWAARVTEVVVRGREVVVHLGCGPRGLAPGESTDRVPMVALVTPGARTDLNLNKGDIVYALFKATAVRVFAA